MTAGQRQLLTLAVTLIVTLGTHRMAASPVGKLMD